MSVPTIKTLGELKKSNYKFLTIKDELRENLIKKLKVEEPIFDGTSILLVPKPNSNILKFLN